ncbi:MAG: cell adhesion protein, partial [Duncaniella sp.]|nr:cell adhesion protein [Duncaniella sp.]
MNLKGIILSAILSVVASAITAQEADYTRGILWVNEDWYGHQNSTVNFLVPDDPEGNFWKYRIIQAENPGMELGCTNQYGALWKGRLYLIAKQEKDPGASVTGGRITVCDAKTMKILHQQPDIDPSGAQCDGRGFIGVDEHKGYISSSNGVWILDLDTYTVTGQVEGSSNPNAGGDGDKPNTDPTGSLYHGQSGTMVSAAGKIFVAHQQYGLLIVDPETDKVEKVLSMDFVQEGAGIGSVVKSKDGNLWISVAKNVQGTGSFLN